MLYANYRKVAYWFNEYINDPDLDEETFMNYLVDDLDCDERMAIRLLTEYLKESLNI